MRSSIIGRALAASLALAAGARAAPSLEIRGAAARVVVIPEARPDIAVSIIQANARLPLKVSRFGQTVYVDGDLGHGVKGCPMVAGKAAVVVVQQRRVVVHPLVVAARRRLAQRAA